MLAKIKILIITSITLLITVVLVVSNLYSAPPSIFFSDLSSGPNNGGQNNKGAFITIWGKGFGSSQGSSYVTVGASQADNYPVWTDTKISFQLGANAVTGDITVNTSEGSSNGVPFAVRSGNIYFVKTTGNDTTGDGSWTNSWRTIIKAKNSLAAGDIAYICDGVTQTTVDSYNATVNCGSHGTAAMPKALVAYPGATVVVGSTSISRGFHFYVSGGAGGYTGKYWIISQLNITGQTSAIGGGEGRRIVGNRITTPVGTGAAAATESGASNVKILGNEYYNCGSPTASKLYHNIYINNHTGATISDIEIGWNIIRDSTANRAIQVFSDGTGQADIADVRIHDNLIYNVRGNGINMSAHSTGDFKVYNNIIYRCGLGPHPNDGQTSYAGIYINGDTNTATIYLYNNVIAECGYSSYIAGSGQLYISSSYLGTPYIKNNVFYSTGVSWQPYQISGSVSPAQGTYNNLFYGAGTAPNWDTAALNTNPFFVNVSVGDFHLQNNSPAKDAGTSTVSSIVSKDKDGNSRPQGLAYDIGAYEYNDSYVPPPVDSTAPAAISNLTATTGSNRGEIKLNWTAPGDDNNTGIAAAYTIKYAIYAITDDVQFNAATQLTGVPAPLLAGSIQTTILTGLTPGQIYYFAIKTQDEVPNISFLSNSPSAVAKANTAPVLQTVGNKTVTENSTLSFTVTATDADGDTLTYAATGLPTGATLNSSTGVFSWTPSYTQVGNYSVTFSVNDNNGETDFELIVITVSNTNQLPILTAIGNKTVAENGNLTFTISAVDLDGEVITYVASGLPTGASFDPAARIFTWTPQSEQSGSYTLVFSANDGSGGTDSESITITVGNVNQTAVLNPIGNKFIFEGSLLQITLSATDADGDTLTYAATGLPTGATLNSSTGVFTWTPSSEQAGSYHITFSVSDGISGTVAETITLTVTDADITAPANVADLAIAQPTPHSIILSWTAPGDDAQSGTAANYDLRYSTEDINESNWSTAIQITEGITPQEAGGRETVVIEGLSLGTYYFVLKAQDEAGNLSGPSNIATILLEKNETKPTVSIMLNPSIIDRTGEYSVTITITEPSGLSTAPQLRWQPTGALPQEIILRGTEGVYVGTIWIETITPQGQAYFDLQAEDKAGNKNTIITSGGSFNINTTVYANHGGTRANKDGTSISITPNTLNENAYAQIESRSINISSELAFDQAVKPIAGTVRDFILKSTTSGTDIITLKEKVIIEIPYQDNNADAIVDGTDIREETLEMFSYSESKNQWELVTGSRVHPLENKVSAEVEHLSRYCLMAYSPASWDDIKVYPNPCKAGQKIKFINLPLNQKTEIYIYDLTGETVRILDGEEIESGPGSASASWDTRNESADAVASGIYLYLIKSNQSKKSGKLAVIK